MTSLSTRLVRARLPIKADHDQGYRRLAGAGKVQFSSQAGMMRSLVPARIGSAWVLFDAEIVREILGVEVWLPIPGARAEMPGVIAWRGRAIPVVDLAAPFGFERLGTGEGRARTLIASVAESIVAVPTDAAREVHAFSPAELKPVSISTLPYALAEAELFERVLPLIDLPRFVDEILGGATPDLKARGSRAIDAAAG